MNKKFWSSFTLLFMWVAILTVVDAILSEGPEMSLHLKALVATLFVMAVGFLLGDIKAQAIDRRDRGA